MIESMLAMQSCANLCQDLEDHLLPIVTARERPEQVKANSQNHMLSPEENQKAQILLSPEHGGAAATSEPGEAVRLRRYFDIFIPVMGHRKCTIASGELDGDIETYSQFYVVYLALLISERTIDIRKHRWRSSDGDSETYSRSHLLYFDQS